MGAQESKFDERKSLIINDISNFNIPQGNSLSEALSASDFNIIIDKSIGNFEIQKKKINRMLSCQRWIEDECKFKVEYLIKNEYKQYESASCRAHGQFLEDSVPLNVVVADFDNMIDELTNNIIKAQSIYQYSWTEEIRKQISRKEFKPIQKSYDAILLYSKEFKDSVDGLKEATDLNKIEMLVKYKNHIWKATKDLHALVGEHIAHRFSEIMLERFKFEQMEIDSNSQNVTDDEEIKVSIDNKATLPTFSVLAEAKQTLADIEQTTLQRIIDTQQEQKNQEYVLKLMKKYDKHFDPSESNSYQLQLDVSEKCHKFYRRMEGYKLPQIKGIVLNYVTSLNNTHSRAINDFFRNSMPSTIAEFLLSINSVNKSEIDSCFTKVFPRVTEKLIICEADISEKDFFLIIQSSYRTKELHLIDWKISKITKILELQEKDYWLEHIVITSDSAHIKNSMVIIVKSMSKTNIKDTLKGVIINGVEENEVFEYIYK